MAGNIEAAADLVSAALLARTFDGVGDGVGDGVADGAGDGAGGAAGAAGHGRALCLNCGTRLIGPHCHRCGQGGQVHRTVGAIGHEIAHGVFHFEGRVWRTLPMLVMHPGKLTRRYIDGERVRFVAPLALFLLAVFLLFATVGWMGGDITHALDGPVDPAIRAHRLERLNAAKAQLASARAERTAAALRHVPTSELDQRIAALDAAVPAMEAMQNGLLRDGAPINVRSFGTGWHRLDEGIRHAQVNPGLALYKLQSSAYKYSWLLIPLSTPFVALLFLWRRRFGLYDHAVFVTYSLSFMTVLVVVISIAGGVGLGGGWIAWPMLLIPPAHLFVQLRGTYALGRWSAAWRTMALLGFAFVTLAGFVTLLLLHGLTG